MDLTGKTVIPALVSAHMHVGLLDGSDFGPQVYTRDKIVEHLQRYAYYGVAAVFTAGTDVGPLSFAIRDERPPQAARLLTAGRGMAAPDGGPGFAAIANTSFPITTAEDGRQRVREVAAQGALAVKIWVDDRGGRVKKLTPDLYRPIIEEAHAQGLMALAHVYYLKDAHELVDAGIDGFLHPVRDAVMDDGLIARMKAQNIFLAANIGGSHRATLADLPESSAARLSETVPAGVVTAYRAALRARDPEGRRHRPRHLRPDGAEPDAGWRPPASPSRWAAIPASPTPGTAGPSTTRLATMAAPGMSPAQVIVASTSVPARLLKLDDLGNVAAGKSADFVVLDANPLDDIANTERIAAVYLRGQALDRAASRAGRRSATAP